MAHHVLLIAAGSLLAYALVSARLQRSIVTPPMAFVGLGLLVGPLGLGWVELDIDDEAVGLLAEIALVIVLFTDASRIGLRALRDDYQLPLRLLAIGMPVMIGLGTLAALLVLPGLRAWEAVLLATILAPTDAALGQAVISSPAVPGRIRQALNVESGLNDGLVLPAVLIAAALAESDPAARGTGDWIGLIAAQLVLGPVTGIVVGYGGGRLIDAASRLRWMTEAFHQLSSLSLALLAYLLAEIVGGNGFIAAFVAGLTMGNTARGMCEGLFEFAETEGQLLTLVVFMILGSVLAAHALDGAGWAVVGYAALSLTAARLVAVGLSLVGAGLRIDTVVFLGWFGPRGLASIVFAVMIAGRSIPAADQIVAVVVATVIASVLAHGITATPGAVRYAAGARAMGEAREDEEMVPELRPVEELPVRLPHRD